MGSYERNHFVPVTYLKGFSENETHIHRLDITGNSNKKYKINAGLKSVGFKYFLLVIDDPILFEIFQINGDDKFIEKNCLKYLENNLATIIEDITSRDVTYEKLLHLIDFVYISIVRNPKYISQVSEKLTKQNFVSYLTRQKEVFCKLLKQAESNYSAEDVEKYLLERYDESLSSIAKFMMHVELLYFYFDIMSDNRKLFQRNIRREIQIVEAVDTEKFITSNFPASTHMYGFGFNTEYLMNASYFLPLNKRFFLSIIGPYTNEGSNQIHFSGRYNDIVNLLNYLTYKGANGEIFSGDLSQLEKYEDESFLQEMEDEYDKFNSLIPHEKWQQMK